MNRMLSLTVMSVLLLTAAPTLAEVPLLIPVQGFLSDADGNPINNNNMTLQFKLFDSEGVSAALLWTETQLGIDVDNGVFSVYLGSEETIDPTVVIDSSELWLEMSVGAEVLGRIQVASVPFAIEAEQCKQVGELAESDIQKTVTGSCETGSSIRAINSDGTVECEGHQPSGNIKHIKAAWHPIKDPLTIFCIDIPAKGMLDATVTISTHRTEDQIRAGVSKYHLFFARNGSGEIMIESVNKIADYTQAANMDLTKEVLSFARVGDRYTFTIDRADTMGALSMVSTYLIEGFEYAAENFSTSCE